MVFFNVSMLNKKQIADVYGVNGFVASYLELVSSSNTDWEEYEEIKIFLEDICNSHTEFEKANRCLLDRMEI